MANYIKKLYTIDEVLPDMEVGEDVLTDDGKIMVSAGTILTKNIIEGLKCWDISAIYIRTENDSPTEVLAISVVEKTLLSKSQQEFTDKYNVTTNKIKKSFETMRFFKEAPVKEMAELATKDLLPMLESVGIINYLQMTRQQDDYTFQHSANVAVICGLLGKWLGYTDIKTKELVLAGLLHDIGKTQIPLNILDKPDALSKIEMDIMQTHTTLGYKLIKDNKELSANIIYGVLQHHERMDGSGYPFQVKADKLHQYARIIAIADTYDAMTSNRVYHQKETPFLVVETMVSEMYLKLDPQICTVFLNNVRNYFTGNIIKLSDGRQAEVVYLGPSIATRPTVRTQDGQFIDLEKYKNIGIVELIEA